VSLRVTPYFLTQIDPKIGCKPHAPTPIFTGVCALHNTDSGYWMEFYRHLPIGCYRG